MQFEALSNSCRPPTTTHGEYAEKCGGSAHEPQVSGFTVSRNGAKLKVAGKAIEKLKDRIRALTRRTRGTSLGAIVAEIRKSLLGWKAYFGLA